MNTQRSFQKRELTVRLAVDAAGNLTVSYYRAGFGLVKQTTPTPLRELGENLHFGGFHGVSAVNALLNVPDERTLKAGLCGHQGEAIGALLFSLLFPDESIWRPVLGGLFGTESPDRVSPLKQGVHLRIWTEHEELLALPWRLATWNRQWLLNAGWTFELTSLEQPTETLALHTPCRILVVVPQYDAAVDRLPDLAGSAHLAALTERLGKIDPRRRDGPELVPDHPQTAVGAPGEDSIAKGVNGDQANKDAVGSGAVYVFVRSGGNWTQQAYLKASNTDAGDWFGVSVALSGDTLAIGACGEDSTAKGVNGNQAERHVSTANSGAVYVF